MSKEFENGHPETEIEASRLRTVQWIYDHLRPVDHVMSETHTEVRPAFETRDYQLDAWASLWNARQGGAKSGLIPLATGLGKTSVGVFDVMKYREEYTGPRKGGPKVLFTSHQDEINQQAAERFAQFIPDMSQGFFSGHQKEQGADVTFATLQSLYRNLDRFNPRYYDYIIYDEAHHLKADTFERVVDHFKPRFQLALTATPDRMDGLDIRKLFGEPLYSKNLADALAEGLLVDVDYHIVFDDAVKEAIQADFNPETLKELRGLLGVQPRNEVIAKNVKEEMHKIGLDKAKTIIFCDDIEHAKDIATLVGGEAYHSGIKSKKERRDVMDRFKHGDLQIICTRDMFNEGVDIPDARLIVFLRTTSSATVFEQQLGRGLRPAPGKDKVTVLDFAANIERIEQVRDLAETVTKRNGTERDYTVESYPERASRSNAFHSEHTDFDFDKLAVDLLGKFYSLKRERNPLLDLNNDQLVELALNIKSGSRLAYKEMQELAKDGKFVSMQTIVRRFGSVVDFHKACGFEVKEVAKLSNEELVSLALELSPDEPLGSIAIKELSKLQLFISPSNVSSRFGSIPDFQKACGFKPLKGGHGNFTKDKAVEYYQQLSEELGRPAGIKDIRERSKEGKGPSPPTLLKDFDQKIQELKSAAGYEIKGRGTGDSWSATKSIEYYQQLSSELGHPATVEEIYAASKAGRGPSTTLLTKDFNGKISSLKAAAGLGKRQ